MVSDDYEAGWRGGDKPEEEFATEFCFGSNFRGL
jgi:hypothetical protein